MGIPNLVAVKGFGERATFGWLVMLDFCGVLAEKAQEKGSSCSSCRFMENLLGL